MLITPYGGAMRVQHNTGDVGASAPGTTVTTGAASGTKGSAAQLISSTNFETHLVMIYAAGYGVGAGDSRGCLDILIGAATEDVLIADLLMGNAGVLTSGREPKCWTFPLRIPAGSRISARAAGIRTTTAFQVWIYLFNFGSVPPFPTGGSITTYGVTAVPDGVAITPGATGAVGAWTEITSSTTRSHIAVYPSFQIGNDTTTALRWVNTQIGIGAATEEVIGASYWYLTDGNEMSSGPYPPIPTFNHIPAGSRLTMRMSESGTVDTVQGALHCLNG